MQRDGEFAELDDCMQSLQLTAAPDERPTALHVRTLRGGSGSGLLLHRSAGLSPQHLLDGNTTKGPYIRSISATGLKRLTPVKVDASIAVTSPASALVSPARFKARERRRGTTTTASGEASMQLIPPPPSQPLQFRISPQASPRDEHCEESRVDHQCQQQHQHQQHQHESCATCTAVDAAPSREQQQQQQQETQAQEAEASSSGESAIARMRALLNDDDEADASSALASTVDDVVASYLTEMATCKNWRIPFSNLGVKKALGQGTSARVYRAYFWGKEVAVKILKAKVDWSQVSDFAKELFVMSHIQHPNIVRLSGFSIVRNQYCMVMEYCKYGSLYGFMNIPGVKICWQLMLSFAADMVRGIDSLHSSSPPICHRDMKSLNLLVDETMHLKLCDFGLARFVSSGKRRSKSVLSKLRGTYAYCAPEIYFGESFSEKSDIFSVGVILWELTVRVINGCYQAPYGEYSSLKLDCQIIIQTAKKGLRPTFPRNSPQLLVDLIRRCWDASPEIRPTSGELLKELLRITDVYRENTDAWS